MESDLELSGSGHLDGMADLGFLTGGLRIVTEGYPNVNVAETSMLKVPRDVMMETGQMVMAVTPTVPSRQDGLVLELGPLAGLFVVMADVLVRNNVMMEIPCRETVVPTRVP